MNRSWRTATLAIAIVVLTLLFLTMLMVSVYPVPEEKQSHLTILTVAFFFSLTFVALLTLSVFSKFAQQFYDLSPEEAESFAFRLIFGGEGPTLEVQEGRVHPDGSSILRQVGGPGSLRIAHDSAVVTQRVARLHRVLGPGQHSLEPFEKVWEVVDLRPQRRSVRLDFITRDGLPVYCHADIRFRVEGGHHLTAHTYTYTDTAVLSLATLRRVRAAEEAKPFQDWPERVADLLEVEMRNILEQYSLDEFLNPRYGLSPTPVPLPAPHSVTDLEARLTGAVRETAHRIGVDVDSVQLGPVLPSEGAISQQWLEFWQANMQRLVDESAIEGDAIYVNLILQAQVNAKVELITTMLNEVRTLSQTDVAVPSELIVLSFVDVLRSIAQRDPAVQQTMFSQAEKLMHILQDL